MPIWVNGTMLDIGYKCSNCGEEGVDTVDATMMQGCAIEVFDYVCPKCGAELTPDGDYFEGEELED